MADEWMDRVMAGVLVCLCIMMLALAACVGVYVVRCGIHGECGDDDCNQTVRINAD